MSPEFFLVEPPQERALRVSWSLKTLPTPSTKIHGSGDGNAFKVKGSKALPRLATEDPKTRPISSQKLLEMTLMRIIPRSCEVFSPNLVGGWTNPFEKYARQIGFIFPNFRGEHKKYLKPPPRNETEWNHETEWNQMKPNATGTYSSNSGWGTCVFFGGGKSLFQGHIAWKFCEESTHLIKS